MASSHILKAFILHAFREGILAFFDLPHSDFGALSYSFLIK
jgi:hypothetical protein